MYGRAIPRRASLGSTEDDNIPPEEEDDDDDDDDNDDGDGDDDDSGDDNAYDAVEDAQQSVAEARSHNILIFLFAT